MAAFRRLLDLPQLLEKKSHFLLGPRATGKSTLIREQLANRSTVIDLLRGDLALRLSARPSDLENLLPPGRAGGPHWIVIDEVQKVPALLDEVHRLIEKENYRFLLTGSSARKLKHGGANLLAGRARMAEMLPLVYPEVPGFDLDRFLRYGGLPAVYASSEPDEDLRAYVHLYLKEEIQAEGVVRKIPAFSRFLVSAALSNGQLFNFAKIASDTQIPATTVREHYQILEDTLVGFFLPAWTHSKKRKAISTAKFYFFDVGVSHALAGIQFLDRASDLYGRSFEHWVGMELRAFLSYHRKADPLSFWRSKHGQEVDFIVGDHTAIEVKATRQLSERDVRGLRVISEESAFKNLIAISHDDQTRTIGPIRCLSWKVFAEELWAGRLI